jgi:F-type H+-transporting ATPase subunit b
VPQLDPTWFASQLFWLVICFTVLYLLLSRLVLPPLMGVISSRQGAIDADLVAAQEFKTQAEAAKQGYEKTLAEARLSAQSLMIEAETTSKEQFQQAVKALDVQVTTQLTNASKNLSAKKQEMLAAIAPQISDFSSLIVEKITLQTV